MKNRYEWNNTKEIDNQKLYHEFLKANISTKLLIYRILNPIRRDNLRKKWDKEKKKKNIESFLNHAKNVLKNVSDYIEIGETKEESDIKDIYELWLICGIIQDIGLYPLRIESAINLERDKDSFNTTKEKMIKWLDELQKREHGMFARVTPLMFELDDIKYKKPSTKKEWQLQERKRFFLMMQEVGIGKQRANNLIKLLEQWSVNAPDDRYKVCNFEWEIDELIQNEEYSRIKNYLQLMQMEEDAKDMKIANKELVAEAIIARKELKKYGIEKDYVELLSNAEWNEKKMNDDIFIEREEADRYYKFILDAVLTND